MNKPDNVEEWDGYKLISPKEATEKQKRELIKKHEEYLKRKKENFSNTQTKN